MSDVSYRGGNDKPAATEHKMKTWTITMPNGSKMQGRMDEGKLDQVNTMNATGNYTGSLPVAVWIDGIEKMKAAGGIVEVSE